ncbi:macrolide family glycosyltransferase [Streptomyces sp. NPDC005876]|jgi:MGT family glycosyltransferase|uniref:macrolide family glycosyltransferase n=1 Tax=unclassified Streptomyces TaxID=2593676 RepID=UPI0033DE17C4
MHLAFLTPNAYGHVTPALPLVRELVRRGHRVSFAVGPDLEHLVRQTGAEPVVLPTELQNPPMFEHFTTEDLTEVLRIATAERRTSMPVLMEYYRGDEPDVVCTDQLDYHGQLLAEALSLPYAYLVPTMATNEDSSLTDLLMSEPLDLEYPPLLRAQQECRDFFAEYGVHKELNAAEPARLNLVFVPEEFQTGADTFDDTFHFIGPGIGDRSQEGEYLPKVPGAPLLYIALGTIWNDRPEFFHHCMDAFADTDWQVVMAVGGKVDLGGRVPPPNFDIHRHLPQLAVLRQADVFLTHNGMGSTMGAVYCGVPMVSAAQVPEQMANARRVEELGLGRRLSDTSADGILTAVREVADDAVVRANVAELCRRVNSKPNGAALGADLLEAFVR